MRDLVILFIHLIATFARTRESGNSSHNMDEKDDEIPHLSISARTANTRNCAENKQFARDKLDAKFKEGLEDRGS